MNLGVSCEERTNIITLGRAKRGAPVTYLSLLLSSTLPAVACTLLAFKVIDM